MRIHLLQKNILCMYVICVAKIGHIIARRCRVGGYTACRIPLVRSANGNGNRIPLNGIPFNGIPFPFVSVKQVVGSSVSVCFR